MASKPKRVDASIGLCLTFETGGADAVRTYTSLFKDAKVRSLMVSDGTGPMPFAKGALLHAAFEIGGQRFTAMDAGPSFSFAQGQSIVATVETQAEVDLLWDKLGEGGEHQACGWLKDKWGVSWQILPSALGDLMSDPAHGDSAAVAQAMLGMGKLDIATLRAAYAGKAAAKATVQRGKAKSAQLKAAAKKR